MNVKWHQLIDFFRYSMRPRDRRQHWEKLILKVHYRKSDFHVVLCDINESGVKEFEMRAGKHFFWGHYVEVLRYRSWYFFIGWLDGNYFGTLNQKIYIKFLWIFEFWSCERPETFSRQFYIDEKLEAFLRLPKQPQSFSLSPTLLIINEIQAFSWCRHVDHNGLINRIRKKHFPASDKLKH